MKLFVAAKGMIEHDGKILIVRESSEYDEGTEAGKWDLPGGRLEIDESLEEGLLREIQEETGLHVTPGRLVDALDTFPTIKNEECHIVRIYFVCQTEHDQVVLSEDHDRYEWIDPAAYTDYEIMPALTRVFERYVSL